MFDRKKFTDRDTEKRKTIYSPLAYYVHWGYNVDSFPASGDFCRLPITFANSLDPDQAQQNVRPDLDANCLTL